MMDVLTVGVYPGSSGRMMVAPLHYARAMGMFAARGLKVSVREPVDHPWSALADGRIDLGVGFVDYVTWPKFDGAFVAVAVQERFSRGRGLTTILARGAVLDDGSLTSDVRSMSGMRVGLLPNRGDDYLCWRGLVDQAGLSMADIVQLPVPHAGSERDRALRDADVDLVIGRRPRQVRDEVASGLVRVWKQGDEISPDLQARYWLARSELAAGRDSRIAAFFDVLHAATVEVQNAFSVRDHDVLRLIARQTEEDVQLLLNMRPPGFDETGAINELGLARNLAQLAEAGLVPSGTRVTDVADMEAFAAQLHATRSAVGIEEL